MIPIPSEVILPFGGYLAACGDLNVLGVILAGTIGGTLGSIALYYVSYLFGNTFIKRWEKYVFISQEHLSLSNEWFKKYGNFAVFTSRILPIVRGLISIPAGMFKMPIWSFTLYTFFGTFIWSLIMTYFGFQLGLSNMSTHLVWFTTLAIAGVASATYFFSRFSKKHPRSFRLFTNVSLWLILLFFISYSLYEAYSPIKITQLNYLNVEKAQENVSHKLFSFYVVGNTYRNLGVFRREPFSHSATKSAFVLDLGNMVYSGDKAKYRILLHEIKRTKIPFLTVPGPLDLRDEGYKNYYDIFGDYDYAFDVGDTRFLMLNDANGKISSQQFNWMLDELSREPTPLRVVLAMNIPPSWGKLNVRLGKKTSNKLKDFLSKVHARVLLLSTSENATFSDTPIPHAFVNDESYLSVSINGHGFSIKVKRPGIKENNAYMEILSVYLYSLWVLEWPVIGILGISILIIWFFFKRYRVYINIKKRNDKEEI